MSPFVLGSLDRRITLQVAPTAQSESGEITLNWNEAISEELAAEWLPGGTRETWQAQQRLGSYIEGVYRIHFRDPSPPPETSRIIGHDGRIFDVKPSVEVGRRVALEVPVVARGESV